MGLFNKFSILLGLPKVGQKITFVRVTPSYFTNVKEDTERLLEIGKEYTVRDVEINSSSTHVWLEEFPNIFDSKNEVDQPFFNMSSFEWNTPELDLEELKGFYISDIFQLRHTYGYGIEIDGMVIFKGEPMLSIESFKTDRGEKVKNAILK